MPAKHYDSDGFLIKRLAADDDHALQILYDKYHLLLSNIIRRITGDAESAKDILQELFFTLWERRHSIDHTKPIKAYLVRSAINRSLNYLRDNKRRRTVHFEDLESIESIRADTAFDQPMELKELRVIIKSAIKNLPPKSKAAFLLKKHHKMSYQEVAKHLGISKKAVEKRLSKALTQLKTEIKPYLKGLMLL